MLAVFSKRPEIAGFGEKAGPRNAMLDPVMPLLETILRSAGLTLTLLLLLGFGVRGGWRVRGDLLAVLGCAGAYIACSSPSNRCAATPAALPLVLGAIGFPFALWRLARVILADDHRVGRVAWAGLAGLLGSGAVAAVDYLGLAPDARIAAQAMQKALALAFVGTALHTAWRGWNDDLVEGRRRLRWVLIGYLGGYGLVVLAIETYLQGHPPPAWLDLVNMALIDLTLMATSVFLLAPDPQALATLFGRPDPKRPPAAASSAAGPQLAQLQDLMEAQKLYRDPEISLASLAARLSLPEYQLRRLIHDQLGHRHFAAFINEYRLREVTDRLLDPALDRRPVLTLALEAGYGSIGPFNRQFKDRHGVTPTAFRSQRGPSSSP
jgi:AraC-like DNA-binding protein